MADVMSPVEQLRAEIVRLQDWIDDLQSGMYINCVYCGFRYGPRDTTPVSIVDHLKGTPSMAEALKSHIETCPKHPMHLLRAENDKMRQENDRMRQENDRMTLREIKAGIEWVL